MLAGRLAKRNSVCVVSEAVQVKILLYLADVGLAMFSAGLITACLQLVIE
jgi:hypothetical protein